MNYGKIKNLPDVGELLFERFIVIEYRETHTPWKIPNIVVYDTHTEEMKERGISVIAKDFSFNFIMNIELTNEQEKRYRKS